VKAAGERKKHRLCYVIAPNAEILQCGTSSRDRCKERKCGDRQFTVYVDKGEPGGLYTQKFLSVEPMQRSQLGEHGFNVASQRGAQREANIRHDGTGVNGHRSNVTHVDERPFPIRCHDNRVQ
jgi:hypothetical protein